MLVIAGGILLAIILLPLLAPALFIGVEVLKVVLPIAGVVIVAAVVCFFYENHKAKEERLSKMTKEEIEAEKKREKEQRKEDLRPGIRAGGITFVATFLFTVIPTGSVIFAVVMSVIFAAAAFYMGMTIH